MNNEETSPDTDQSPESPPPTSDPIPSNNHDPAPPPPITKPDSESQAPSPTSPITPKSPKSPKSKTLNKPKSQKKSTKSKDHKTHKTKHSKSKTKTKSKSKSSKSKDSDKDNGHKSSSKSKTPKTKEQADELLSFLSNSANDVTARYNASKRIHSFILNLQNKEDRIKYATQFLSNHEIQDEKIRGVFIDFMCKFATCSRFDGLDSFTVILRPFTQLLVYAIQEKGKKSSTTIKRIVYGFAQIYPVMLARLCRVWKGAQHIKDAHMIDSDDEANEDGPDYSKTFPKYTQYKAVFDVSQKIVDNILLLLPAKKPEVRDFAIKFAKSMILHTTCHVTTTKDKNRFSLTNIREGHPLLNESQLTSKAKAWLKALTDSLNKPRKLNENPTQLFTKKNCENAIKGLFGIAKERPRLRTPVINSLKQWVDDNYDNDGTDRILYKHNQNMLKEGFKWFVFREDCRQHYRACMAAIKHLTEEDLSEYREIQKQINIRRKEAANNDKKHIASQKERTKQHEIKLLLELDDEYLVSLAINCCKQFEIEEQEAKRLNSQISPIGDALKSLVKSLDDAKAPDHDRPRKDSFRKPLRKQLVPLQLKSLSENEKKEIINKCWHRLMSQDTCHKLTMSGHRQIHAQLVAKLYSSTFVHIKERDHLVDVLTNTFHKKYRFAIQWLYHLAVKRDQSMYCDVLRMFLSRLRTKLSPTDKLFTQFIINLPVISDDALKMVKKYASGDRITLGLATMRDIILYRPKHSQECLQTLLEYTTDGEGEYGGEVSNPAIRCVVNKLYPKDKFKDKVEQFACDHFEELQRTPQYFDPRIPQPPVASQLDPKMFKAQQILYRENKQKWQRSEQQELKKFLTNHSQLFFALCTQKPVLLSKFIETYIKCRPNVQIGINRLLESLIKYWGKEEGPIINLIASCPKGGALFVEEVARVLTDNGTKEPSTNLFNALVVSYFDNTSGGGGQVRVFLPILKDLNQGMITKLLPALLGQLDKDQCKEAIGQILKRKPAPVINPSTLLVEIQCFAPTETSPHIEKIIALTNYCLGQGAYDKTALSAVLQQLVAKDPIPVLFMRTLIQTLLVYPDLTKYAMNILESLIFRNEIWKNKHLWDGFIRCCAMTQPESYAVLCKLGKPELQSVLLTKPELRAPLLEFALESTVRPYVLEVLKQDPDAVAIDKKPKEDKKDKKDKIKIKKEPNRTKKRSRDEMQEGEKEIESELEPSSKKKRIMEAPPAPVSNNGSVTSIVSKVKGEEEFAAYRVQFFLNKFVLESYKNDGLFKMENFLRHNFANLLKIEPSQIVGVKCHRQIPENIRLPHDTVICEVIFLNTAVSNGNGSMKEVVETFKQHLQTMDFSSWKIWVGSQYVTIQPLPQQKLLLLIKELGLTLGSLDHIAQILQLAQQTAGNTVSEKHHRSRKHRKKRKHRRKHKHRSRRHRRKHKHRETSEEEEEDEDTDEDDDASDEDEEKPNEEESEEDVDMNANKNQMENESSDEKEDEDESEEEEEEEEEDSEASENEEESESEDEDDQNERKQDKKKRKKKEKTTDRNDRRRQRRQHRKKQR